MPWTLVTGGAKGLGEEIVLSLAREDHDLVIHYYTNEKKAFDLARRCHRMGVEAHAIQGDFSTPETVHDFISRYLENFSKTMYLINNVGYYLVRSGLKTATEEWRKIFQINFFTPLAITNALLPHLLEYRGSIINIGVSGLSSGRADTYSTAYTLSKKALFEWTKSLAKDLAPFHVRANMVSPGILDNSIDKEENDQHLPMRRSCGLNEIARVVSFLLEKESSYITGQNIEVAGGNRL